MPAGGADIQSLALIDQVWDRLHARLEKDLTALEVIVSALFDRPLDSDELSRAIELCASSARELGLLGFPAAADMVRRVSVVLASTTLGMSEAISMAGLLDDARAAIASVVIDLRMVNHSGFRLLVVGPQSEHVDQLIWLAAAQSLRVTHDVGGPASEAPADLQDYPVAAVLVVVEDPELGRAKSLIRGIREEYPQQPIVVVAPETTPTARAPLADTVTTIIDDGRHPLEIVNEVRQGVIRSCYPMTTSVIGGGADQLAADLRVRGLAAFVEPTVDALFASLASGRTRAVVIAPDTPDIEPVDILRVIRTDRRLRSTVVAVVERRSDPARVHGLKREGADDVISADADADDLAVAVKARLVRRGVLEPVDQYEVASGIVPWNTAQVLLDRMLTLSFRRHAPVGLALVEFETSFEDRESGEFDANMAREFRREDVLSRVDEHRVVVALQGVDRATIQRRIEQLHQKFSLHERNGRAAVVQFPVDGRSVDELLDEAEKTLASAGVDGAPEVLGSDWRPEASRAADVLLIDPDDTLGSVLTSTLGRRGLTVQHEADALDALEVLTARKGDPLPRVVLLELDLRGVDGLQFLRQIREAGVLNRCKVIILSARNNESDLRQAFELGAEDFVPKPFSTPLLLHRLHRALNS